MLKNLKLENTDPQEIEMGIDHELKTTKNPEMARKIATTNLSYYPDYYSAMRYLDPPPEENVPQEELSPEQLQQIQMQSQQVPQEQQGQAVENLRSFAKLIMESDPVKKKITYQGIPIDIEWEKGSTRQYPGSPWKNLMRADYGYIRNTNSPDGEEVDVYVNNPPFEDSKVYQIIQLKTGENEGDFDEYKFMLGFNDQDTAIKCYKDTMQSSMFGGCIPMTIDSFKNEYLPFYKKDESVSNFRHFIREQFLSELVDAIKQRYRIRGHLTDPITQLSQEWKDKKNLRRAVSRTVINTGKSVIGAGKAIKRALNPVVESQAYDLEVYEEVGNKLAKFLNIWKALLLSAYDHNISFKGYPNLIKYKSQIYNAFYKGTLDSSDNFYNNLHGNLRRIKLQMKNELPQKKINESRASSATQKLIMPMIFLSTILATTPVVLHIMNTLKRQKLDRQGAELYNRIIKSYIGPQLNEVIKDIFSNKYSSESQVESAFYKIVDSISRHYPPMRDQLTNV